jgi:PAS domain S-box-containing protein
MFNSKSIPIESEAGFRVLFECATISILVINQRGKIELANPCAEKLFGYSTSDLIGKPVELLIPESLRHKHESYRHGYFSKPKARPMGLGIELFAAKKDGEVFPVEISLGHYELQGEKLAVAFITDITEQVKAKKIVAEREAWFRSMADNSPVMIWVSGVDKLCNYFNNTWLEFTGRTLEQEIGNGWAEGVHPDDLDHCLNIYLGAFDARAPFSMEYRLRRHDGQYRWIQDAGKPTYTSDNLFTGYIGSCTDIHDQRMMKEELERMVQQRTNELSEALEREKVMGDLKSKFVSMASHEFRTPLTVVLSSAALIEQYAQGTDEKMNKHVNRIKSSVGTLTSILNDFLSLDKLEQGQVEIEREVFNLRDFIEEVVEELRSLPRRGQHISVAHHGGDNVWLDRKKLRYIILNLLSNAIKYSGEGTAIEITTNLENDHLTILVADHGIGIPPEEQKHIFSKFFRANNSGTVQGTGLGLTIAKRYVELLDGTISFNSKVNEGTTFVVTLPQHVANEDHITHRG